ncbi:DNA mismatch repair endonuclease MutL [Rheinheimera texasensis]|uniref:DNA mismatch repair endonuclease MutL n=1 Tax=Rheinheimera texasensis TaxID=306205 RepID=UPI0004E2520B|nr:DNA mismatch repair endonuclease MutL [Rheinheimera texasensis]
MTIQLLPPQLANQIAAGEVVERPASVIKELVENSLDAGATEIQIDVEKGGSKLLRVRDNGSGIAKDQLTLALSRHATSKIHDFADLAKIVSLGFRGEALASISSVSRLTLTSRPAKQESAWQAMAEGRDMAVQIKPAAHPVGTSIEVLDLFFNTPARRRFLKSDKTEFSHIDELVKRLALSRYDVSWTLTHNGQLVRQLKAVTDDAGKQKRLAQLCGRSFAQSACYVESQYEQMRLSGWVLPAACCTAQLQVQYCYVNGRMMRDKLLNHAIRQAYADALAPEALPAFVLYLDLEPEQVDVNVHPAKHEVRFHQARLVHDFVYSALTNVLSQVEAAEFPLIADPTPDAETTQAHSAPAYYAASGIRSHQPSPAQFRSSAVPAGQVAMPGSYQPAGQRSGIQHWPASVQEIPPVVPVQAESETQQAPTGSLLLSSTELLLTHQQQVYLLDIPASISGLLSQQLVPSVALLLPERLRLEPAEISLLTAHASPLSQMGFDLVLSNQLMIIRAVPQLLQGVPLATVLPLWWSQWQEPLALPQLWRQLLQLVLQRQWLAATTLLQYQAALFQQPELWHAVPIDLSMSRQQLQEQVQ